MNQEYLDTVRLLLDIAPVVFQSPQLAMKGGTALNLFVQDLPRLSVDIDVVFVDYTLNRESALKAIATHLNTAKLTLEKRGYRSTLRSTTQGDEVKMYVENQAAQVKVEVNFVFRGTVLPVVSRPLMPLAQELFTTNIVVPILDTAELYGSKLVAAMDRQHPRDIFDVLKMQQKFGLQSLFIDCFVAYLAGHNRPVHEVLYPAILPLEISYQNNFAGMTRDIVPLEALKDTQQWLQRELPCALTSMHREFLLSLVKAEPAWELLPFAQLQHLPALRWKLLNLNKLKSARPAQFASQYDILLERF
jgi:predicted nucleotidyltransferase component of viral defense system